MEEYHLERGVMICQLRQEATVSIKLFTLTSPYGSPAFLGDELSFAGWTRGVCVVQ